MNYPSPDPNHAKALEAALEMNERYGRTRRLLDLEAARMFGNALRQLSTVGAQYKVCGEPQRKDGQR
jgi:hypothetical protein